MAPARDISGQRFGSITAICATDQRKYSGRHIVWKCVCDCGKVVYSTPMGLKCRLKSSKNVSCGCHLKPDMVGRKFGWLEILSLKEIRETAGSGLRGRVRKQRIWECKCRCGKIVNVSQCNLTRPLSRTTSCGCYKVALGMTRETQLSPDDIPVDMIKAQQTKKRLLKKAVS